jgi:hypothetical protein
MTPKEVTCILGHTAAYVRLYDLYRAKAPTADVIAAFHDVTATLHDLLRVSEHGLFNQARQHAAFREANGSLERWMQVNDEQAANKRPR